MFVVRDCLFVCCKRQQIISNVCAKDNRETEVWAVDDNFQIFLKWAVVAAALMWSIFTSPSNSNFRQLHKGSAEIQKANPWNHRQVCYQLNYAASFFCFTVISTNFSHWISWIIVNPFKAPIQLGTSWPSWTDSCHQQFYFLVW
jgi:hypothetical protein